MEILYTYIRLINFLQKLYYGMTSIKTKEANDRRIINAVK